MYKKILTFITVAAITVSSMSVPVSATTYLYTKVAGVNGFDMKFEDGYGRVIVCDKKKETYWADAWYEESIFGGKDVVRGWHSKYDFKLKVVNSKYKSAEKEYGKTSNEKKVSVKHTGKWVQYEFYVYK